MKNLDKNIKDMKAFGIQMLVLGAIALVLSFFIDQFVFTAGSGIMLFIGIDMLRKSNKLKKQQKEAEKNVNSEESPIMKVGTGYVAKGMDKLKD